MKGRPWELRRQVLRLQTVTVAVLIAMVWFTMLSTSRTQANQDTAATGTAPPSWWALLQLELRPMLGIASLMLGVAIAGNALVSWRVRRATRGLGTQTLAWMLDFYDGVLRAAREGLLLVDPDGRVQLINGEARRLLGLPVGVEKIGLECVGRVGGRPGRGRSGHRDGTRYPDRRAAAADHPRRTAPLRPDRVRRAPPGGERRPGRQPAAQPDRADRDTAGPHRAAAPPR